MSDMTLYLIAAAPIRDRLPEGTLEERIRFAMNYAQRNDDLFFMGGGDDDGRFRTALAAVLQKCSDEEKVTIDRSLMPLKMLSAAMSGIPIDFSHLEMERIVPLMKWWHEERAK